MAIHSATDLATNSAEVAIAILFQGNRFLMQLRDDIPTIVYPGYWTFFGGHVEPGESPETGVWRELQEEIGYQPPWLKRFERHENGAIVRNVFYGPLTVPVEDLILGEGWDLGLWTVEDIQRGERYSAKAQGVKPIGPPHQAILLRFLNTVGTGDGETLGEA
ncbi:NUDIX hydrolase [Leptolyngbya sp. PCC 6406]|uniref:NUDIX hydrolase n=1 Tax=Leptolyngbya sp. PCC 6406 TaxID=1173264 RepID=UPI0002EA4559|nr:NUDIX hydrolase [Leptolyngbya sp. PCC 6406]